MAVFAYRAGRLHAESVALEDIASRFGTPCFVYSRAALETALGGFQRACARLGRPDTLVCYAMKANSNLAILNLFAKAGAGFDIVSGGELERVLAAGGDAAKVVFSGVGKTAQEMRRALEVGILCFNVESEGELMRLNEVAGALGRRARISLRVNPDVDPKTHPYISTGLKENKFGIEFGAAADIYRKAAGLPNISVVGIDCHIGSQLTETAPFIAALDKVLQLVDELEASGIVLEHFDLGGGLGIRYQDETPPAVDEYLAPLFARLAGRKQKIMFEPGRHLVGNAGVLLTRVEYLKHNSEKNFAIVDAAMNDLMRPALYQAWHDILPVAQAKDGPRDGGAAITYDIVGPVCETGDWIGRERPLALTEGDLLAVMSAGAYGMSMSSNYNSRVRAAEVMVDGTQTHQIRARETPQELFALEQILP
jgi:diaminopimelate decarboxylase